MTAEFRGLCAEEAYLQQEHEKLHELRNKVKLDGEHWDGLVSSSSKSSHGSKSYSLVGIIVVSQEYHISGSSLVAAMDQSSLCLSSIFNPKSLDTKETEGLQADLNQEKKSKSNFSLTHGNEEKFSRVDERNTRGQPTVDIAEVLRRWTHALQRIHKQSLQLAKTNDGEDPELLKGVHDVGTSNHAESLAATLSEHRQHLDSIQVAPTIQNSISELTKEVNSMSSNLSSAMKLRSNSPIQAQKSGRASESDSVEVVDAKFFRERWKHA